MHARRSIKNTPLRAFLIALAVLSTVAAVTLGAQTAHATASLDKPTFAIPGAISAGNIATVVTCTNFTASAVPLEVDFFDATGAQSGSTSTTTLSAGGSYMVSSGNVGGVSFDALANAAILKGSAKVLAAKGVGCSAILVDGSGAPKATLTVLSGTKQRGD